jgi:hypothetical protein
MSTSKPTVIERLNKIADELEDKANIPKGKDGKTVSESLDRVADAVRKLPCQKPQGAAGSLSSNQTT